MAVKYPALRISLLIMLAFASLAAGACGSSGDATTSITPALVSFDRDIQPIFDISCVSCHNITVFAGGLNLSPGAARNNLVNRQSDQSVRKYVIPGSPDTSYLMNKLNGTQSSVGGSGSRMPPGQALPAAQISLVRQWITQGAP